MNYAQRFEATRKEIEAAYSNNIMNARPIYFEYVSANRRIVVLGDGSGFEIETSYHGSMCKGLKQWASRWGVKADALAWAKYYSTQDIPVNRMFTLTEKPGKIIIGK